ncbi:MAG TPA: acetoacetate--CoA ligase [Baekduia sp.]|nr:acetoacetate--CoA ligase [Baekduia sp.]
MTGDRPVTAGEVMWRPTAELVQRSRLAEYVRWLATHRGLEFEDYASLWRWSIDDLEAFWRSIWDFAEIVADGVAEPVLPVASMPAAEWFPNVRLNYAEHLFQRASPDRPALVHLRENEPAEEISWGELRRRAGALADHLRRVGVGSGDRVVAYLGNGPEAVIGLIAATSIGAVWSVCAPDFGVLGVESRFAQLDPKVLIATNGYRFNGKVYDRSTEVAHLIESLPTLDAVVLVPTLDTAFSDHGVAVTSWADATGADVELTFTRVPFDHPLWVLFSSGTTGMPKGIVHGHGGVLLEHVKNLALQTDLREGDRFLYVGSTSWMVFNLLVSGLLHGATVMLLDASPTYPDHGAVWRIAAEHRINLLGVGAGYVQACANAGLSPRSDHDLSALRQLSCTGSPLSPAGFGWVRDHVGNDVWLSSASGGTDVASSFVGGCPLLPVRAGRLQAPALGVAVQAWDPEGNAVVGSTGELVITQPMPSMPLYFWNDPDGKRLLASYFTMYPGVWRHGDFIEFDDDLSCVISGRSDSTLNRKGIRMGSAEIYAAVEQLPDVLEALVIGAEIGDDYYMPLFVVLADGADPDAVRAAIVSAIRRTLSPRHVPDDIIVVDAIPHTRTGKKLEVPIKRLIQGETLSDAVDTGSVDDASSLGFFVDFARARSRPSPPDGSQRT